MKTAVAAQIEEVTTLAANIVKVDQSWTPEQAKELPEEETESEPSVDQSSTDGSRTLQEDEDHEENISTRMISSDSAQMIIVVVGGIIIAEMVFIFVRCRRKAKDRETQRGLIPYTVDPKVNPNLKYEKVGKEDGDLYWNDPMQFLLHVFRAEITHRNRDLGTKQYCVGCVQLENISHLQFIFL